ncbi:FAD synthetase family protein [uncultured Sphaerochaeta sp.]|uniref:FAD synthetase family protein n=1 Tax=uncultured Sphaerochaeta sp. TaxID=886478 RepID=UPI002A0A624B|nr:FAD synthetase family protein [uncultured Sphaerochaeta sp.]
MIRYDFMYLSAHPVLWQTPMCVSIGVFDGLHIGHQMILKRAVAIAKEHNWNTMAITFDKNPKMASKAQPYHERLTSEAQSVDIFAKLGIDHLVVIDFSPDFSKLTAEEFLAFICSFCTLKAMVVGEDFRCGAPVSSAGPVQLQEYLSRLAPSAFLEVPPFVFTATGEIASSTIVRQKLLKGALEEVQSMLGRPYSLDLAPYPSKFTENGLLYRTGSFMQLLPPEGKYEGSIVLSDARECAVLVYVDASGIRIVCKDKVWNHKAVRAKCLSIAKRSVT